MSGSRRKKPPKDRVDGYQPKPIENVDPWGTPEARAQMAKRAGRAGMARWDALNMDGWVNTVTGIGDFSRDKTLGGQSGGPDFQVNLLTNVIAEQRWRGSDLGKRIVETIPDEMTREGFDVELQPDDEDDDKQDALERILRGSEYESQLRAYWRARAEGRTDALPPQFGGAQPGTSPSGASISGAGARPMPLEIDEEAPEMSEAVAARLEELRVEDVFWEALCYERAYGGGAILLGTDDDEDLAEPLDEERVGSVNHLTAFAGGWDGEVVAWSYYNDPRKPKYGLPEMYMLRNLGVPVARIPAPGETLKGPIMPPTAGAGSVGGTIWWVHESRFLLFPGVTSSRRARVQMRGWGDSVFTRVDEVLQQYGQTWGGIANLMQDFSQAILAIEGLAAAVGRTNGMARIQKRALAANISRSIARMLLIDSKETFKRDTVSLAGISDVLQQFALRLAAAADMPVDLLMGQGSAGALNKGDTTVRFFYDRVASSQKKRVVPALRRLTKMVMGSKDGPTDGVVPKKWSVKPRPLYQLSALEKADLRLKVTQADEIAINTNQVTPEEVAAKRYGGSEFDDGCIALDLDGRAEMQEQAEADAAEQAEREAEMHAAQLEAMKNPPPAPEQEGAPAAEEKPEQEPADDAPADDEKTDEFDPDQPRESNGQWGAGGAGGVSKPSGGGAGGGSGGGEKKEVTISLKENTNKGWSDYHSAIAAHLRSQGQHALAEKHEAVAAKYEKKAAKKRSKSTKSPKA